MDKMTRKEAIEWGEFILPYIEHIEVRSPIISKDLVIDLHRIKVKQSIEILLFIAKKHDEKVTEEALKMAALKMELKQKEKLVEAANNLIKHVEEVVEKLNRLKNRILDSLDSPKKYALAKDVDEILTLLTEGSK